MTERAVSAHIPLLPWLLLLTITGALYLSAPSISHAQGKPSTAPAGTALQAPAEVRGTWSGTLFPKHSNVPPFTITLVISPDAHGNLVGISTLSSDCLKDARLEVTVTGSKVLLSGSDDSGNNITLRGTVDKAGTLFKASYILNGSATGSCETDNGTGNLSKRP